MKRKRKGDKKKKESKRKRKEIETPNYALCHAAMSAGEMSIFSAVRRCNLAT